MASEFEKWEQGKLLTGSVFNVKQGELVCSCMSPELAAKIIREHNENDGLRRRIHIIEHHNQWFERCESGWCNPSADCNPALGYWKANEIATPQRGKDGETV